MHPEAETSDYFKYNFDIVIDIVCKFKVVAFERSRRQLRKLFFVISDRKIIIKRLDRLVKPKTPVLLK